MINPCFFLYFEPERYWDPRKYPAKKNGLEDHCIEKLLNRQKDEKEDEDVLHGSLQKILW